MRSAYLAGIVVLSLAHSALSGGGVSLPSRRGSRGRASGVELQKKMGRVRMPKVEYRQAPVQDVIAHLGDLSRELDPDKTGVNLVLNLNAGRRRRRKPVDEAPFGIAESRGPRRELPLITLKARDITLLETLKLVCKLAGLKMRIEGSVVMIVPKDAPDGDIVIRTYNVVPGMEKRIKAVAEELRLLR